MSASSGAVYQSPASSRTSVNGSWLRLRRLSKPAAAASLPPPSPPAASPLLLLSPVRVFFHSFLTDLDAVRLLQTSVTVARAVLADVVLRHVFECDGGRLRRWQRQRRARFSHYERCGVRLNCSFSRAFNSTTAWDGPRLLPSTLHSLVMGQWRQPKHVPGTGFVDAAAEAEALLVQWKQEGCAWPVSREQWEAWHQLWTLQPTSLNSGSIHGRFDQPLPPSVLPHGLRFLALSDWHNQPLQRLSLPASITVLHLGRDWKAPLSPAILPSALRVLVFNSLSSAFNQPLYPGVLPATLRVLVLSERYNQPIGLGVLPDGLLQLSLGRVFNQPLQPGWAPSSLDTLILSACYDRPLLPGCLPSVRSLVLGLYNFQPLTPGVIPEGVRLLKLSVLHEPLQPGGLPASLRGLYVAFRCHHSPANVLSAGVLPSGLRALFVYGSVQLESLPPSLELLSVEGDDNASELLRWRLQLNEGALHAGLRWLSFPQSCKRWVSLLVPPGAHVQWREH